MALCELRVESTCRHQPKGSDWSLLLVGDRRNGVFQMYFKFSGQFCERQKVRSWSVYLNLKLIAVVVRRTLRCAPTRSQRYFSIGEERYFYIVVAKGNYVVPLFIVFICGSLHVI